MMANSRQPVVLQDTFFHLSRAKTTWTSIHAGKIKIEEKRHILGTCDPYFAPELYVNP